MNIYRGYDQGFLLLAKTDFTDVNGTPSFGFKIEISSWGFAAVLEDVWFYGNDLKAFSKDLEKLIIGKIKRVHLKAMSDCRIDICAAIRSDYYRG